MTWVPRYRGRQVELLRSGRQKAIIVGGVPIPAGQDPLPDFVPEPDSFLRRKVWDEICREAELMGTLKRSRFRNTFGEQISLPDGVAESLEDLEQGLRSAGFIGADEVLCQSVALPGKFRVRKSDLVVDHDLGPSVGPAAASLAASPGPTEDPSPLTASQGQSRAESGASLDGSQRAVYVRYMMHSLRRRRGL